MNMLGRTWRLKLRDGLSISEICRRRGMRHAKRSDASRGRPVPYMRYQTDAAARLTYQWWGRPRCPDATVRSAANPAATVRPPACNDTDKERLMRYATAVLPQALWRPGLPTSTAMGGFIQVLALIALVVALLQSIPVRRALQAPARP